MRLAPLAFLAALSLSLAACGSSPGSRAVSGGLLGAGAGAAVGSLSGDAGKGALIGAAHRAQAAADQRALAGIA